MGGGVSSQSTLHIVLRKEYMRVLEGGRAESDFDHASGLTLDQILMYKTPRDLQVDFLHLGVLFQLDVNKDGFFSLQELFDFAQMCAMRRKMYGAYEFQARIQGHCTIELSKYIETSEGVEHFIDWFCQIVVKNGTTLELDEFPGVVFIQSKSLRSMHRILKVKKMYGMSFAQFFDMLQQVGEELSLLPVTDPRFDDVVPAVVVHQMGRDFVRGFGTMVSGLQPA